MKPRISGQFALDHLVPRSWIQESGVGKLLGPHIVEKIVAAVEKEWQLERNRIC